MGDGDLSAFEGMSVMPEPGWVPHTPHGTARCGDGPGDYLVRLADVVRWFQNKHRLPLAVAVGRVIDGITVDSLQQMFFMEEQGWARPMWEPSPWDEFSMTPEEKALPYLEGRVLHCIRGLRSAWLMPVWEAEKFFNTGRPAGEPPEYDKERETVFEFIDRKGGSSAVSAVRMSVAHELWGWGSVATAVAQPDTVANTTTRPTTAQELEALLTDSAYAIALNALGDNRKQLLAPENWSFDMRQVVDAKLNALMADGKGLGRSAACTWVGVCLGVSRSAIAQQMTKLADEREKLARERLEEAAGKSYAFSSNKAA